MTPLLPLHTTWALIGDSSRYRFAAWLTEQSLEISGTGRKIWIAQEIGAYGNAEDVFLQSLHVPPGIRLCVLPDSDERLEAQLAGIPQCIVFEEFPWQKDSTKELLYALGALVPRPVTALMLMKQRHRAGSTDLDKVAETMAVARKAYQKQGLPVYSADRAHIMDVFTLRDSLLGKHREILRDELAVLHDRMDEFAAEDYAGFLATCNEPRGCLSMQTKEAVFSYRTALRRGENCLWTAWNKAAEGLLFAVGREGNLQDVLRMYENILCATELPRWADWDVSNLRVQLEAKLKAAFWAHMRVPAKYDKRVAWDTVRGESAYARLLLDDGAHLVYWKKYREFVTESVRIIVADWLHQNYKQWEGMIS